MEKQVMRAFSWVVAVFACIGWTGALTTPGAQERNKCDTDTVYVENIVYVDTGNIYNEAINHLKEYEGFRSKLYYDTDGSKTIGYGHHLRTGENYTYVSEDKATSLLVEDLNRKIEYVHEVTDTLSENQALALGLFAFNVGTGNLDKALSRGLLNNIYKLTSYCHYKTVENGTLVTKKSQKLYERRKFELHIYTR